jgi:hypothetical protein
MRTKSLSRKRTKTLGQQERYEHVTKAIFNEKLKCKNGTWLRNVDVTIEDSKIAKKVRRIIEKRMCQTYHKQHKELFHENGNQSRHNMKRAVSYELYIIGQVENINKQSRGNSTHWKRQYDPITGKKVFKKKVGYKTIEEAKVSAIKLLHDKPWCSKTVNVYKCAYCDQYHIGHDSIFTTIPLFSIQPFATA